MLRRCLIALLLVAVLGPSTGCVYYNTFYHARAAAREAELMRETRAPDTPPGPAELDLLDRVAEKCGRVLQLHPDSDWADDALLLLGTTHYHQQRFESAEQRLTEFLTLHPDSELAPEAQYMLASVLLERGNPVTAETYLQALAEQTPPHHLSDDALALIGEARNARKKYAEASEAYAQVLERFPRSDRRAEIRFLSAENYEESGDLDEAARHYALVQEEKGARTLAFEARMRLVQVDLLRGSPEEALEVLSDLERRTEQRDDLDRVLLLKGEALEATGAIEDAIATYEGISASHSGSDASGEAYFRVGVLKRDYYEQLEEAAEAFKKAKDEAPRSDIAVRATDATRDVNRLVGFLATIEADGRDDGNQGEAAGGDAPPGILEEDTVPPDGVVDDTTRHVMLLPSLGDSIEAVELSEPAEATMTAPDTTGAAAAEPETPDMTVVVPDTSSISATVPDTVRIAGAAPDTAALAGVQLEGDSADTTVIPEPEDEVAIARFRAAELYLFRFEDAVRARTHYASVVERHPDSPLAPKAALAIAWILETKLDDAEGAQAAYELVVATYPESDFAAAAQEGLERLIGNETD